MHTMLTKRLPFVFVSLASLLSSCASLEGLSKEEALERLSSFHEAALNEKTPEKYTIKTNYSSNYDDNGKTILSAKKHSLIDESRCFVEERIEGTYQGEKYFHDSYLVKKSNDEVWKLDWLIIGNSIQSKTKSQISDKSFESAGGESLNTKETLYHSVAKNLIANISFLENGNFPYLYEKFEAEDKDDLLVTLKYGESEQKNAYYHYEFEEKTISKIECDDYSSEICWSECDASIPQLSDYELAE